MVVYMLLVLILVGEVAKSGEGIYSQIIYLVSSIAGMEQDVLVTSLIPLASSKLKEFQTIWQYVVLKKIYAAASFTNRFWEEPTWDSHQDRDNSPYITTGGILTDPTKYILVGAVDKEVAKFGGWHRIIMACDAGYNFSIAVQWVFQSKILQELYSVLAWLMIAVHFKDAVELATFIYILLGKVALQLYYITMHPKFGRSQKPLEAKSRLEEQSFVEEGSPWFSTGSPEEMQELVDKAASGSTTGQGSPCISVTSVVRRIVEFIISQLLKAITLGLLVVSFNWNGSFFGVRSSDADHGMILAQLEQLQTAARSQRLEASMATFSLGLRTAILCSMHPGIVVVWGFLEHDENIQRYRSVYLDVDDEPPHEVIEAARRQNPSGSFIKLVHMEYNPLDRTLPVQTFPVYQNILRAGFDFGLIVVEPPDADPLAWMSIRLPPDVCSTCLRAKYNW
ncbi:hypothetical protein EDD22DRAFT_988086 [Suillus occidentalis]|nr:hypothetical protein EDD22DRAFT_988086 [Suillus occidentalis]